jgi:hypothetical protein
MFQMGIAPWSGTDSAVVTIEGIEACVGLYVFYNDGSAMRQYDPAAGITVQASKKVRYITLFVTLDKELAAGLPVKFVCASPYPNPCRNVNRVQYTLPYQWRSDGMLSASEYEVKIAIYDLAGRKIRDLAHRKQQAGTYTIQWDTKMNTGRVVTAGAYIFRMQAGNLSAMKKITVFR